MDLSMTPDALAVERSIQHLVDEHLPDEWRHLATSSDLDEASMVDIQRQWGAILHREGALAPKLPRDIGGMGLHGDAEFAYIRTLGRAGAPDPANGNVIDNFGLSLATFGTSSQKAKFLPPMLDHSELWCQGFSEPGAGSDLGGIRTRGTVESDRLRIDGQKVWTSHAQFAEWCFMLLRTGLQSDRHAGLTMAVVNMKQPGVEARPIRQITGSSGFCEVFFDGAYAEMSNVIGGIGQGWKVATFTLAQERSTRLALRSIQMSRSFQELLSLAAGPGHQSGPGPAVPIDRLVDAYVDTLMVESLVRRNIAIQSGGDDLGASASMGKLTWSQAAQRQATLAADLLGDRLGSPEYRNWLGGLLSSRATTIYGGTSEIQRNLIARSAGLPVLHD